MARTATIDRQTSETTIHLTIDLDGTGQSTVDTGIGFMDHMLTLFAKHGFYDLTVKVDGDLEVDQHHSMEDLGIVLGQAIREALGDKQGIRRYGFFMLPMDETLVTVALDLSGRPYLAYELQFEAPLIGQTPVRLFKEFFWALTWNLGLNLHIDQVRGEDAHHVVEATFKGFARALDMAISHDSRETGVPSTKGTLV